MYLNIVQVRDGKTAFLRYIAHDDHNFTDHSANVEVLISDAQSRAFELRVEMYRL